MTDNADLAALTEELAALRARVDELTTAAAPPPDDPAVSRRHLLRTLAGLGAAGAATAAGIATADPAAAADGDNLILGQSNAATAPTDLTHTAASPSGGNAVTLSSDDAVVFRTRTRNEGLFSGIRTAIEADASDAGLRSRAIHAIASDGFAVDATNDHFYFPALAATNKGLGPALAGASTGGGPQLWLYTEPGRPIGPPPSANDIGQVLFDPNGDLWLSTEAGDPGKWTRLLREDTTTGRVIPITPVRVLDTRTATGKAPGGPVVPGQVKGPLKGGQTVTLDLAGITPIPANATGIIGNATVITPTATGFLRLLPAGATIPASSFNFTTGTTIANGFTTALNPTGITAIAPVAPSVAYHLVIDIAAYIT